MLSLVRTSQSFHFKIHHNSFSSALRYKTTGVSLAAGGTTMVQHASIAVTVRPGANVTQIPESACADLGLQGTEYPVLQVSIAIGCNQGEPLDCGNILI